jgi:hypothetical protein
VRASRCGGARTRQPLHNGWRQWNDLRSARGRFWPDTIYVSALDNQKPGRRGRLPGPSRTDADRIPAVGPVLPDRPEVAPDHP